MTCREFADFIVDYLSGELAPASRTHFENHLRDCENCRRYLHSYEESIKLGKLAFDGGDDRIPPDVPETLVQAILAARRKT